MSDFYYIHKLMNLKDFIIKNVQILDSLINVYVELPIRVHKCPSCATPTSFVHDYRVQKIKDVPIYLKPTFLHYRKRRYICPHCRKKFYENNSFVARYQHMSGRLRIRVLESLRSTRSMASIAKDIHVSSPTIGRILSGVQKGNMPTLPNVLSIDEFKGDTSFGKYQCIVTNPEAKKTLDILPTRNELSLRAYFRRFSLYQRNQVSHIVIDMWPTYRDISHKYMPNAIVIVDSFHVVKNLLKAFISIRIRVMKVYETKKETQEYYLLKNWNWLLTNKNIDLDNIGKYNKKLKRHINYRQLLELILTIHRDLDKGYSLLNSYYNFNDCATFENAEEWFDAILVAFIESNINEFNEFITLLKNWRVEIINSFIKINDKRLSNGPMESLNGRFDKLESNANGLKNYDRLRNRSLYCFNKSIVPLLNTEYKTNKIPSSSRGKYKTDK